MKFRRFCTAIAPLLVAACGGGSSSIAQADFVNQEVAAYCAKVIQCCPGTTGLPTQATCVTDETPRLAAAFNALFVDAKITYSPSAGGACISEFNAAACNTAEYAADVNSAPDCDKYAVGTVANGQPCAVADTTSSSDSECQSGLCINVVANAGGNGGVGICAAVGAVGAACPAFTGEEIGNLCAQGSFADYSTGNCACTAVKANGAACDNEGECTSGYCDTSSGTGVCAAIPATISASYCAQLVAEGT